MNTIVIKERTLAITRLVLMVIAILNSFLVMNGTTPIPVDEAAVLEWVTHGVDAIIMVYCGWWKDNNVTRKAIARGGK